MRFFSFNFSPTLALLTINPANLSDSSQYEKPNPIVLSPPDVRRNHVKDEYE